MPNLTFRICGNRLSGESALGLAALAVGCAVASSVVVAAFWTDKILVLMALVASGLVLRVLHGRPRLALVLWFLCLTMIPVWVSVDFVTNFPLYCLIALLVMAATAANSNVKWTSFDALFIVFFLVALAAVVLGGSSWAMWAQIVIRWGIPFFAARVLVAAVGRRYFVDVFAIVFGAVGVLAILEYLTSWHPFINWTFGSAEFEIWREIQVRSGADRSEWAFGHSIALGGSLAVAIPFILGSSYRPTAKAALLIGVFGGIATTGSRSALIAGIFTLTICLVYLLKGRFARAALIIVALVSTFLVTPLLEPLLRLWAVGSSNEERWSFEHRSFLYTSFMSKIQLFGQSVTGSLLRGVDFSTDSAVLRLGLEFGWIVLLGAILPLLCSLLRVIFGRASLPELALVGQIPLFATVALITQYESVVFVAAAAAIHMAVVERTSAAKDPVSRDQIIAKKVGLIPEPEVHLR